MQKKYTKSTELCPAGKGEKYKIKYTKNGRKTSNLDTPGAANRARASGLDTSGSKTWEKYRKNTRKHSNFDTQSAATEK